MIAGSLFWGVLGARVGASVTQEGCPVFDAALSRSKLETIASAGLWVPVGAAGAAFRFIRENSRMNKSFANED